MKYKHLAMIMGVMITATSVVLQQQHLQQTVKQKAPKKQVTLQKIRLIHLTRIQIKTARKKQMKMKFWEK